MNKIWANRLIAGTKIWDEVPENRKSSVLEELNYRKENNIITQEQLNKIIGLDQ